MMAVTDPAQPFSAHELYLDRLDELEDIWSALVDHRISAPPDLAALGAEYARVERLLGVEGVRVRTPVSAVPATPKVPMCARGLHLLTEENTIKTPIPGHKCRACRRLPYRRAPQQGWPPSEPSDWS